MVVVVEALAFAGAFLIWYNIHENDNPPASIMDRYVLTQGFFCGIIYLEKCQQLYGVWCVFLFFVL